MMKKYILAFGLMWISLVMSGCGRDDQVEAVSSLENTAIDTGSDATDQTFSTSPETTGDSLSETVYTGVDTMDTEYAVAKAVYPVTAQYPLERNYYDSETGKFDDDRYSTDYDNWLLWRNHEDTLPDDYEEGLSDFYEALAGQFLTSSGDKNRIISPINLYLALGMLSEITDGVSQDQILSLLGARDIDTVRDKASALWEANYRDDGVVTTILADSLWLNEDIEFDQDTLDTLAVIYYASTYQGEMGSDSFDEALKNWLNEQTGGLLKDEASGITLDPATVIALASTIYYKAAWADEFSESNTSPGTFHAASGDITHDFMHQSTEMEYVDGDNYTAVCKPLAFGGDMWLMLPDEGVKVDDLMTSRGALSELFREGDLENERDVTVNLSMPKFDVVSTLDLVDGLKALGVTDIFDPKLSNFTPLLDPDSLLSSSTSPSELYVSQATHSARVTTDEEGVEAAAFTVMAVAGTALAPPDEVDFTLDRPFIFCITGEEDVPLFVGVVNEP